MPTRLRVDIAGYHHIINRGINRCDIFNSDDDKDILHVRITYTHS